MSEEGEVVALVEAVHEVQEVTQVFEAAPDVFKSLKQPTSAAEAKELFHRLQVTIGPWLVERIPAQEAKAVLSELLAGLPVLERPAGHSGPAASPEPEPSIADTVNTMKDAVVKGDPKKCFAWLKSFLNK
jgi:hypothetical protein